MTIKSIKAQANLDRLSVHTDSVLDQLETVLGAGPDMPVDTGADGPVQLTPAQTTRLYATLRRLREELMDVTEQLYVKGEMPIDRLCTVITNNLDSVTDREALNLADSLYGPGLLETMRPVDKVKVAKAILAFFDKRKLETSNTYWDLIITNKGFSR